MCWKLPDFSGGGSMHIGKLVFAQLMDYLPLHTFRRCVAKYPGRYPTLNFSHLDQFLCMAFAQLTYRESLRDIETCLRAHSTKLYHLGIRGGIARSTLADANETRDWRIYQDFALSLIQTARKLYAEDNFGLELTHTVYALDSTTIDLCLALFPWARFRKHKGAVKLHTLLDLRGNIPAFIHISDGKLHDVNILDRIAYEAGSFYVMDRGYIDFARLHALNLAQAFFVTRAKTNLRCRRIYSRPVDKTTGPTLRPNHQADWGTGQPRLSNPVAEGKVLRCQKRQISGFSYQQLRSSSLDYRRALSLPLASGVVLQMDQAASAHQGVFRHFRKCRQNSDLDRHRCLCARRHSQETPEIRCFALHNPTDFKSDSIRKNTNQTIGYKYRIQYGGTENA
jgi:hypothetical protein